MKNYKQILTSFVEVVTFLIGAFGGFLKAVAPPLSAASSYAVGIMSFLILIVLMIVSAISRRHPSTASSRTKWLVAGAICVVIAVPSSFIYPSLLNTLTYPHESKLSDRRVIASDTQLTADAQRYKSAHPDASTPEDLVHNLPDTDIWTPEGTARAESKLLAAYACLVLSLSTAIFCLLEANIHTQ